MNISKGLPVVALAAGLLVAQSASASGRAAPAPQVVLPADTLISVASVEEISSKHVREGDVKMLQIAQEVSQSGVVVIPRGAPVKATVTWRTGRGVLGKSGKFELAFNAVTVNGVEYALKGSYRQEGRGNTTGALLGAEFVTGRSGVIASGQVLNAFTAVPIPAR